MNKKAIKTNFNLVESRLLKQLQIVIKEKEAIERR